MWEQVFLIFVSAVGFVMVWFPWLGSGRTKSVANWVGISLFSIPWFLLPFTAQPRLLGMLSLILSATGILFFVFGIALSWKGAVRIFDVVGWAGHAEPLRLVTEGPYGFVRHPIYSGLFMAMFGWSIWRGMYSTLLTPILYLLFRLEACLEEKLVLERKFGEAYASYRDNVPAFFPIVLIVPLMITAFLIGLSIM